MKKANRKPKEYLFVDGYNIINSWESLKLKKDINLEEARDELMDILAEYHHYSGIKIILVFDAHFVKDNLGEKINYKGIQVVFTKERESADHYIEKKLNKVGRIKRIRVATSDWLEQQIILSRGGTRISARELEIEVKNKMRRIKKTTEYKNKENNSSLGRLDDELLDKLENWKNTKK